MLVVVSYDVNVSTKEGRRRLRKVAKTCVDYGQRVQYSVFECLVDPGQWIGLRNSLVKEINFKTDSLRFYFLGANWKRRVEHIGAKGILDLEEGVLII